MKHLLIFLALFSFNVFASPVNINKADAKTIASALKGIGPAKADAIVKYRTKNGPFKSINDLQNVPGIGEKILRNIASDVGLSGSISKKTLSSKASKTTDKASKTEKKSDKKVDVKATKKADKKSNKEKVKKTTQSTKKKEKKSSKPAKSKKTENKKTKK